jgi:hypothetical protein
MATTYTTLLAEVASYLSRADLTSMIPTFVQFAQTRINREVRVQAMETKNATFSITGEYVNVPSDFLEVKHFYLNVSPRQTLVSHDLEGMTDEYPSSNKPKYFQVVGSQFRFSPVPDATYTATLIYYAKPATLVTTSQETNSLFPTIAPDLYLYASLLEAEPFIQNDPRIATWGQAYERGIANLASAAKRASTAGGSLMTRPA